MKCFEFCNLLQKIPYRGIGSDEPGLTEVELSKLGGRYIEAYYSISSLLCMFGIFHYRK